mmetsp:Transcript_15735/g.34027  ORF Transcript_15735/g.34027 Transcript_15735/m.34027 type:complete len:744 (-) Transcript_15735:664-2895(-)
MVSCFSGRNHLPQEADDIGSDVSSLKSEPVDASNQANAGDGDVLIYRFGRRADAQVAAVDTKKSIEAAMQSFSRANRKDVLLVVLAKLFSDQPCVADLNELARQDPSGLRFILPLVINTMLYGFNHVSEADAHEGAAEKKPEQGPGRATDMLAGQPKGEKALEEWLYAQCIRSVHFAVVSSWYLSSSLVLGPQTQHHRTMTLLLGMESAVTMNRQPVDGLFRKATLENEATQGGNAQASEDISTDFGIEGLDQEQADDVKQFLQVRKERGNVFHAELDFVKCLTQISWQLFLVPREERKRALRGELERLNQHIPATAYLPSVRGSHRVLRVCPDEAFPFSTKERCPFMLVAEVLLLDDGSSGKPTASAAIDSQEAPDVEKQNSGGGAPIRREKTKGGGGSAKKGEKENEMRMEPNHAETAFNFKPSLVGMGNEAEKEENELASASADPEVLKAFGESWKDKTARIREQSKHGKDPRWRLVSVIVKARDQLRQEMFAAQLVKFHERAFSAAKLPLWVRAYEIEATSSDSGFIEAVVNSNSLDSIKKNTPGFTTLRDYFRRKYGSPESVTYKRAVRNFVESMAGYSVISYVLQIKDRHNGNLLLDSDGHLIHIDFGFLLSNSPGGNREFEKAPFKLTSEMVELMGGLKSNYFRLFRKLCARGYVEVCRQRNKLLLMVDLMMQGNMSMPCFVRGRQYVLHSLSERLTPGSTNGERKRYFNKLIDSAAGNLTTKTYDMYQKCFTGIH